MRRGDLLALSFAAVRAQRSRSLLTIGGIAVGIATVVLLTALGEGIRQFVIGEFTQFGTNLLAITPGKSFTFGGSASQISTTRPLSLDDAAAVRRIRGVEGVVPVIQGNAEVEYGERRRRTMVFGVSGDMPRTFRMAVASGRFLHTEGAAGSRAFAVLGARMRDELFGDANPLGARIRIGTDRFRVVGVMQSKGQMLGFDLDDTVFVPIGKAAELFDREGVMEIDVLYREGLPPAGIAADLRKLMLARHGQEDFSITTQDKMLEILGSILTILTAGVGALGGVSLLVGAVGIGTIMTIAVAERTGEVGLLRALGARRRDVMATFLVEASALGALGGMAGVVLAIGVVGLLELLVPVLPLAIAWPYAAGALALSVLIGIGAGLMPAARAARLDPIEALRAE